MCAVYYCRGKCGKKDIIITGAQNVFAPEVEAAIFTDSISRTPTSNAQKFILVDKYSSRQTGILNVADFSLINDTSGEKGSIVLNIGNDMTKDAKYVTASTGLIVS